MARMIVNGQSIPVEVVFVGEQFNIWKLYKDQIEYSIHCSKRGRSITVTPPESMELEADLQAVAKGESPAILEKKWEGAIADFIGGLKESQI